MKMDKTYTHCADCDKKFKKKDEVVLSTANGNDATVHVDCLFGWLTRWNNQEYFDTHDDMVLELELDK